MSKLHQRMAATATRIINLSTGVRARALPGLLVLILAVAGVFAGFSLYGQADAASLSLCGNQAPASPVAIKHVVVVMMENRSYKAIVGSTNAPYQTSLASSCGVATAMFGATHTSAANYLAMSAGEFPPNSPGGCGSTTGGCSDSSDNLYHQLDTAGKTWKSYEESMGTPCNPSTSFPYKIGHNPPLFYTNLPASECQSNDLPVTDLTAQSGPFWNDLQNQTLPELSWVTPNESDDNEGTGTAAQNTQAGDAWLQSFLATVQQSNSYQSGDTAVLVTYDEGTGADSVQGEDCTNESLDMPVTNGTSAYQDSCHIPFFVVYPYTQAGTSDGTFFDHYSVTKTIEDIFGLPYLVHAGDAQTTSLIGHFGLNLPTQDDTPTVSLTSPSSGDTLSGTATLSASATSPLSDVNKVEFYADGNLLGTAISSPYSITVDTTQLADGSHSLTAKAYTASGASQTSDPVTITVDNTPATACAAPPAGYTELSGNLSLETDQTGWTGVYNSNSNPTRVQVSGGSYDGNWALSVNAKASTGGTAGVNNANPIWVPGGTGTATVAGKQYVGSAMVRAAFAGQSFSMIVRETTTGGTGVGYHTTTVTLADTAWHTIQSPYTAANSGDMLRYSLYSTNFTNSSQYFLADCLSLQGQQ